MGFTSWGSEGTGRAESCVLLELKKVLWLVTLWNRGVKLVGTRFQRTLESCSPVKLVHEFSQGVM